MAWEDDNSSILDIIWENEALHLLLLNLSPSYYGILKNIHKFALHSLQNCSINALQGPFCLLRLCVKIISVFQYNNVGAKLGGIKEGELKSLTFTLDDSHLTSATLL